MARRKKIKMVAVGTRGHGHSYGFSGGKITSRLPKRKNTLAKIMGIESPERIVACIIGDRNTGKTESAKEIIKKYKKKERVLIIDTNDEYTKVKKIKPKQIATFKGVKRIVGNDFRDASNILSFRDGLVVFDSPSSSMDYTIGALAACCRSKCVDVLVIGSVNTCTPKLLVMSSCIELHQSNQLLSNKMPNDAITIAEYYVESTYRYKSIIIDLHNIKFAKGSYIEDHLIHATRMFAYHNLAPKLYEKFTQ